MLQQAKVLVGNSSAGLIEAAIVGTPSVNVGLRQQGRESPSHVTHVLDSEDVTTLRSAIKTAMARKGETFEHPYGDGQTGQRIANILATLDWDALGVRKCCVY